MCFSIIILLVLNIVLFLYSTEHISFKWNYIRCGYIIRAKIYSACPHGIVAGYCALCDCRNAMILHAKAECTHNFVPLTVQTHFIGAFCDFGGGEHLAITNMYSIVKMCHTCSSVICSACYVG